MNKKKKVMGGSSKCSGNTDKCTAECKQSFLRKLLISSELPPGADPFSSETVITISDNMSLTVSACKKIMLYRDDIIRMCVGRYIMELRGQGMTLRNRFDRSLELTGIIESVRFVNHKKYSENSR